MGRAGGSARAEYERRRARDAARRRSNRSSRVALTVATPVAVYCTVRYGVPWVVDQLFKVIASSSGTEATPKPVDGSQFHLPAVLFAVGATLRVAWLMWGSRPSTEAWKKGATGEVATGQLLGGLPEGYRVRHDLSMPGSRANIDHVVVGPTGVFAIETKNYEGGVRIDRGRVSSGGRRRDEIVTQAAGQAQALSAITGQPARPFVVVHGGVKLGWFSSPAVDGVRFCSPRQLVKLLTSGDHTLSPESVEMALGLLDDPGAPRLAAPLPASGCSCGGHWVERRRRSDGAKFLGCSRFPACRSTRSLAGEGR